MENPFESGTVAWQLFEAGNGVTDAQIVATYRAAAALVASFNFIGQQIGELAQQVEMLPFNTELHRERATAQKTAAPTRKRTGKATRRR